MPDGSSSAAPVIKPGPSLRRNRVTGFFDSDSFVAGEATAECGAFIFSTPLIPYSRCAIANEQASLLLFTEHLCYDEDEYRSAKATAQEQIQQRIACCGQKD
jgi:hypothetical protein